MHTRLIISAMMAAALAAPLALAQTPAKADKAATPPTSEADMDKYYAAMQERYKKMQDQMARLSKTKDPKERQKILDEHWITMHEGMDLMMGRGGMGRGMGYGMGYGMGPGGGGMGMWHGGGMGPGAGMGPMSPEMMEYRQRRMEQRLDMMQMMMDQMVQQQGMRRQLPDAK